MIGRGGGDVEAGSPKRSSKSRFASGREEAEIASAGVSKSANKIAWNEAAALRMLSSGGAEDDRPRRRRRRGGQHKEELEIKVREWEGRGRARNRDEAWTD